jgi:Carboxypeptidase regulatory-like domain
MKKSLFLSLICISLSLSSIGQSLRIMGRITDTITGQPLANATILLKSASDTAFFKSTLSSPEGRFFITEFEAGSYQLLVMLEGYDTLLRKLTITEPMRIGQLFLKKSANVLNAVEIKSTQVRVEQKGDTTQYNANAFKTHKDATAEELVNKLPGITNDGGTIKAHGEEVKKVLIDGKPFFGDDAAATLKNIPADMIDKIQVFDKMSDQAQFTGYDDGSGQKTINLITKNGGKGQFGKIYAGYGPEDKYQAGGNFNKFNAEQRFSILGMSNNINQQNFTSTDLLGVSAGGSSGRRGGDGGSSSGFNVGTSKGIAQTHAFGLFG